MRRNALIAAIAAALFSVTALAQFGPGPQGNGPGPFAGRGMMQGGGYGMGTGACMDPAAMAALNLSAEQRTQISAIQTEVSGKRRICSST